jgi:hypothetical protein
MRCSLLNRAPTTIYVNEDEFNDRAEYNLARIGHNLSTWLSSSGLRCSTVSDRELGCEGSSDVPLEVPARHDLMTWKGRRDSLRNVRSLGFGGESSYRVHRFFSAVLVLDSILWNERIQRPSITEIAAYQPLKLLPPRTPSAAQTWQSAPFPHS